jgi:hypothetical protein
MVQFFLVSPFQYDPWTTDNYTLVPLSIFKVLMEDVVIGENLTHYGIRNYEEL